MSEAMDDTSANDVWFATFNEVAADAPAAFFDRDGTLIENVPYLADPSQVRLEVGAQEAIRMLRARGFAIVVVTNQSGIARGLVTADQYASVNARMLELLAPQAIDAIVACPFHADGIAPFDVADHPWRKPSPGMIDAVVARFGIARSRSLMIGDSIGDIEAGLRAGLGGVIHVASGHGERDRAEVEHLARRHPGRPIRLLASLEDLTMAEVAQ